VKKTSFLFLATAIALWAQKAAIPPLPPLPPLPPDTFALPELPPFPDLEFQLAQLQDLELHFDDARFDKLARLGDEISAKVSAKVAGAVNHLNFKLPAAMAPQGIFQGATDHERNYEAGLRALDGRHYERALEAFSQAAMTTGARTDGALFWKAYALGRLGRRDEALAALAALRKSHASSRWLGDAQALEAEIKQSPGQTGAQADASEEL
jgi:hypothetical protein